MKTAQSTSRLSLLCAEGRDLVLNMAEMQGPT